MAYILKWYDQIISIDSQNDNGKGSLSDEQMLFFL